MGGMRRVSIDTPFSQMFDYIPKPAVLADELQCGLRANALDRFEIIATKENAEVDELSNSE